MKDTELVVGPGGRQIFVNPRDPRGRALKESRGNSNPMSLLLWRELVRALAWDVVVDVGANYGEMLAGVDLAGVGKTIAFEPNETVLPYLRRTLNELAHPVELRSEAVGHANGSLTFTEDVSWSGRSGLDVGSALRMRAHDMREYEVPVVTLDSVIELSDRPNVCVKIDVEGTELDVLTGAVELCRSSGEVAFFVEILQLGIPDIAYLARRFDMYVLDRGQGQLVQVDGSSIEVIGSQIFSPGVYAQDAVLVVRGDNRVVDAVNSSLRRVRDFGTPAQVGFAPGARVVYTAIMGEYEDVIEQPMAVGSSIEFICFTDNPQLTSETWKIVHVEPHFPADPIRSARSLKILGHPSLSVAAETLWIDNRVVLAADPREVFDALPPDADALFIEHSFRETVREEFDAVLDGGYDDPGRITDQLLAYSDVDHSGLDSKPFWTGMMVRRQNQRVERAMRVWMDQVMRYSRRDQLSIRYALAVGGVAVKIVAFDNRQSSWHEWLDRRSPRVGRLASPFVARSEGRRIASAGALATAIDRAHQFSTERRTAQINRLRGRANAAENEAKRLRAVAREYDAVKQSRSFRLARRLSRVLATLRAPFKRRGR